MSQRILLITNDFPPRRGGIETFCYELAVRLPGAAEGELVVYTSRSSGDHEFDAGLPFRVVRDPGSTMLPTRRVARRAVELLREHGCDRVVFGAAAPMGLLARDLRSAGARRLVAITHGHELWWARVPGARQLLRRIARDVDVLTHLGHFTGDVLRRALPTDVGDRMVRLAPGVDPGRFRPDADGHALRERFGLGTDPVVLCVCRLVPRKGVDTLVRAMTWLRRAVPGARLVVVGGGPDERRLRALAAWAGVADRVVFVGAHPPDELPGWYAVSDVFAMPCRSRLGGLEAEGLGIVFLEAAASGLPVLVGDSGGAPEAVRHGETGYVVDGRDPRAVAGRLAALLADPARCRVLGRAGREWVLDAWTWDGVAERVVELVRG
ncbi:glycosyltransferase family 4 protein [Marinitenerispora sediminis]|uniref:Alpha-(1-2)-phosphatidylinositol mannosyltransferase n=1 Tax=Marinitenerispora sediminis TaxID=1931232 RepID=A0A368T7C2_9ACTN|nr:glycosyltransferase family 4 protein [Marinitenerispora sediminis]RCV51163.1 alpha-(1-2)-phosphatidylinositol mannosyltransferase [Marinitenerispora sediminis]RCV57068.1 alpha-(1-2)-phosphatidylinositol mannosyltransferase [Marinitenerispora sediminis]RCV59957.1 alpha-(1-2)-phosphatidylinositol mannosyltransferase [Marinitenerispora sediminis]